MHPFVISNLDFYFIFFAAPAQRQNAQNYFSVCARRENLTALKFDIIPPMNNSIPLRPKVAVFASTNLKGGRSTCRGILDYARKNGPWRCMLLEGRDNEQLLDIKRLGFDGIISHAVSRRDAKALAEAHIPIVLTEPWPEMHNPEHPLFNTPSVKMDSHGVGVLAAEYYLKRGYKSFAYVGETLGKYWSAERCAGFRETLAKAGYASTVYNSFTKRERRNWDAERPRMIRFLQKLPKPTAIFAAMDNRARLVLDACAEAGIRVPEEIAVLGVDNDPILCESAVPRLSSIWTGGFKRGQKAAEMLDCLMRGRAITDRHVNIGPISVISRESTGYDVMQDPAIARAIHFIRNNALLGRMDVNSVVQHAGCSRRYAEIRFRNELGSSIREFIIENRISHARHLLAESNLSIREIAERCGFSRDSHLAVLFKKNTGLTMRDYRSNYRATPDE